MAPSPGEDDGVPGVVVDGVVRRDDVEVIERLLAQVVTDLDAPRAQRDRQVVSLRHREQDSMSGDVETNQPGIQSAEKKKRGQITHIHLFEQCYTAT